MAVAEHSERDTEMGEPPIAQPASYLRDWVYGGIDGSVTTFAIVSGVAGAALSSNVVLILGFANLLADGFSMAAGNYSSSRTESEQYDNLLHQIEHRIRTEPESARQELHQIYSAKGFAPAAAESLVDTISSNQSGWARTVMIERYGLTPVTRSPWWAAFHTYAAFLVCGIVPLIPYLIGLGFAASVVMTGIVFFAIGSLKSRWTEAPWFRSGLATLAIGGAAATIAYLIGYLLKLVVGDAPI